MAGKGFCVKIRLELHAITCPGVWLCPNGKVALRITSFGSTLESHRVSPIFPLLFHNEFYFKKTFTRLAALTELQRNLEQEFLYAELIQWLSPCNQAIPLATFETNLADLLYPVAHYKGLLAGVDVDLLMDPTKYFPGIIAPKIEVSTKTVIEEVLGVYDANVDGAYVVNPKTIDSKRASCAHRKRPVKGIIRQRKVCHSRTKGRVQICRATRYRSESSNVENSYQGEQPRINECYHPTKERSECPCEITSSGRRNRRVPTVCGNLHIFDNCPVCLKYRCYFSCECDDKAIQPNNALSNKCKENPKDIHAFERNECFRDNRCCSTCCRTNDSVAPRGVISTVRSKTRYTIPKNKELFRCTEDHCKPDACISEYGTTYLLQPRDETKQGFYKNLERFYKQMYKQARLRAQEANVL